MKIKIAVLALVVLAALIVTAAPVMGVRTLVTTHNMTYATPYNGGGSQWKAVDATNDMYVWSPGPSGKQIFIVNTTCTSNTLPQQFVLKSGFGLEGAIGDLTINLATNKTYILGPFETARYKQTTNQIYLNFNKTEGYLFAVNVP